MSIGARRISPEQGPPLAVPLGFFTVAPLALAAAGVLLVVHGGSALSARDEPRTLALVHLGTIGFLLMVMVGALYQLVPVIGGTPIRRVRQAHLVLGLLAAGGTAFVVGLATGGVLSFRIAGALLLPGLLLFLGRAGQALWAAGSGNDSLNGLRLALLGFVTALSLGGSLLVGRAGLFWVEDWGRWVIAHAGIALLAWVGLLISAVSWQVLPMFYLSAPFPAWLRRLELGLTAATLIATPLALLLSEELEPLLFALAPGALAVGALHPAAVVGLLLRRKRRKVGHSVRAWYAASVAAPAALLAAAMAAFGDDRRWAVLFGWLALVGWAGATVHGMLARIVPFLIWFHDNAAAVGERPVPMLRELLPEGQLLVGLSIHAAALFIGALAIATRSDALARLTGGLLVGTAAAVLALVVGPTIRSRRWRNARPRAATLASTIGTVSRRS
jgi:hypothetical protein